MIPPNQPMHAGLVARRLPRGWAGVLLLGSSGRGKSDLTLRLLGRGWRLVADDRVLVWTSGGRLFGRCPPGLRDLLEVRHLGVMAEPVLDLAQIWAIADCAAADSDLERIPASESFSLLGVGLSRICVRPLEASAPDKLERLVSATRV